MTKRWYSLLAGGLLVAGCSGVAQRPGAIDLQEGINLLDVKDAAWGANAAYKESGRLVFIETRVGSLKPEIYRNDAPNEPAYEMDLRFVDQDNHTFYVMRGGDTFADPTWAQDIAASRHAKIDFAARAVDFKLAQKAATALGQVLPASFKDHTFHVTQFAKQLVPSEDPAMIAKTAQISLTPPPAVGPNGEQGYGSYNNGGYEWLETDKYSGSTGCAFWICAAKHSATIQWSWSWNGSAAVGPTFAINANNHGRAYNGSGMGYDCYSNGGWYWARTITGSTAGSATGSWDGQGACQTGYSWSSNNNAHLCNDDAAYELWEAKYGDQNNISFSVQEYGTHGGAGTSNPSTFSCNYPNGDWNTPNCP